MLKKQILEKFKKSDLSQDLLSDEIINTHKDIIFNDDSMNNISQGQSLRDSFYIDGTKQKQRGKNLGGNRNEWRGANQSRFFGNAGQNALNTTNAYPNLREFINNLEMSRENDFNLENAYVYADETKKRPRVDDSMVGGGNTMKDMLNDASIEEEFYYSQKNSENIHNNTIFTKDIKEKLEEVPVNGVEFNNKYNFSNPSKSKNLIFTPVKISMVYKINEKLKYPKGDPLWYIYHTVAKSSFGPISSIQLEEIYNNKNIDGQTDVRFIDIFKIKNKGPFSYFKLKEIENPHFLRDCIDGSSLVRYIDELNKVKKEENHAKVEIKPTFKTVGGGNKQTNVKNTKIVMYDEYYQPMEHVNVFEQQRNTIDTRVNKPIKSKNVPDEKNALAINKVESIIDKELGNEKGEFKENTNTQSKKKGGKKKMKGKKLVDLDIKTGFYTLSQQEKNYEPIYICGDNEREKEDKADN